ncbi:imidazole glycerol phosphate synthase HisH [Candidatus Termititenax persephonae]|uniref:Imidazole glycerol phosphate synthase subunit HisH n=1 Tax=Candidatus Termititenax persephonae TaxID=2218525 RepID=A0A388THT4_9BACT|nr:imidazole glycerol phosphate synthase HisH [Candidatus Termititenax persephonae]
MKLVIVDYGMGNLRSVQKAVELLGFSAEVSGSPQVSAQADKLILPGVGAFPQAMANLRKKQLLAVLQDNKKPLLGICLGLQLLLSVGEEFGVTEGLGLVPGRVQFFRQAAGFPAGLSVPHMGWNDVRQSARNQLFRDLPEKFSAYFVHSYYALPDSAAAVSGWTDYGVDFCSALESGNVYGVQFHPEKSGEAGLQILRNFLAI